MTDVLLSPVKITEAQPTYSLPGRVESVPLEIDSKNEDYDVDWQNLKLGFGSLKERFKLARAEVRALGHLATFNLDAATADLSDLPAYPEPEAETQQFRLMSLKERVRWQASGIYYEEKEFKRRRNKAAIRRLGGGAFWAGTSVLTGYLIAKYSK